MLWLLWACQPPDDRIFDPVRVLPALEVAPLPVALESGPGLRDLRAVVDFPETFQWFEEGVHIPELTGPAVPAERLWPGATWQVEVLGQDGRTGTAAFTVPEPPGGNVLVLLLDDVGVDKVSSYGRPESPPTPVFDSLAEEGVRFTHAYASMVCSPTRGSLMTGRHASRTGLGWIVDVGPKDFRLPLESVIIPEMLAASRGEGWSHSAAGKWHMAGKFAAGYLSHPLDQGFDWFAGRAGNPRYAPGTGYYVWDKNNNGVLEGSTTYMTTDTTNDAIDRIAVMPEPWFMYVSYNAVHTPLAPPPAELVVEVPDENAPDEVLYDSMLEALETEIARLLDSMEPAVRDRTTIVLVGDNGTHDFGVAPENDTLRNKHTPYEGGVHVPLIVAGPHVGQPGTTSDALVHVVDILPTIADIAGVPLTGTEGEHLVFDGQTIELDGRSLLPHLEDPTAAGRSSIYAEGFYPMGAPDIYSLRRRAVREPEWKLVRFGDDTDELYRLDGPYGLDVHDLLADESLSTEATEAYDRLAAEMARLENALVHEGF